MLEQNWRCEKSFTMIRKRRFLAAILLVLFQLSGRAISATVGFKPAQNYGVGTHPVAVAVGDFNGDGNVDLAVANHGDASTGDDGNVSILLGNGDGTFQAAVNHAAGRNPTSVAAGDFNGDGRKDLVVASSSSPTVSVLLGNGDGTFQAPLDYAAGPSPLQGLVVQDFNGDNQLDLAVVSTVEVNLGVSHEFNTTVTVLLGNGDGSFQTPVDYPLGVITASWSWGRLPIGLAAADLSGDGELDLAVATNGPVAILLGTGNGSFTGPTFVSDASVDVAVGAFTGDGHPDLVVSTFGLPIGNYQLFLNNGDGTFQGGARSRGTNNVVGDFDGDGKLDLAGFTEDGQFLVSPPTNFRLAVWLGNGDGTFQPEVSFPGDIHPSLAADLDGNKSPDLLTVNGDNTISVLLNTVGTEFSISASAPSPATVSRGQSSTSTVTLNHLNAFDNPVTLACSVQPTQSAPTCSLNPNSVTFDANGNATAMLTINTGAATASLVPSFLRQDSRPLQFLWLPVAGLAFMGAGVSRSSSSKRRLLGFFVGCVLFAGLILQAACGGGSSSSSPKSQAYTITVTGTSGSTQHSTAVTLTVQ